MRTERQKLGDAKRGRTQSLKWQKDEAFRKKMLEVQTKQGYRSYGSTFSTDRKGRRKYKAPTLSEYLASQTNSK
jgi:hypothetical protein